MNENEVLFVRSSKKSLNKSSGGGSSTNEDDVWDDTILIEAYDKAVQLARQSYLKKKQSGDNVGKVKKKESDEKWKVGDKCRCQYSEDLKYYEADVIEILGSTGMYIVKYVGYENVEKVPLKRLKPSQGESARLKQIQEALSENANNNEEMDIENNIRSNSGKKSEGAHRKSFNKKKEQSKERNRFSENGHSFNSFTFPFSPVGSAIIPPPPPPHMFNNPNEDENETEAMSAMLISWYMSGYHTGYYQGLKMAKKQ